jgi:hypothetical protein
VSVKDSPHLTNYLEGGDRLYENGPLALSKDATAIVPLRSAAYPAAAAAIDAILARAERVAGVIVSRLRLPPLESSSAITCWIKSRETRLASRSRFAGQRPIRTARAADRHSVRIES